MQREEAPVRLAVLGAAGRLGRAILEVAADHNGVRPVAAVGRPDSAALGAPAGAGLMLVADAGAAFALADVVVDVSHADAVAGHARLAAAHGVPLAVGVTGLAQDALAALDQASARVPILVEGNFSLAVHLLARLVEQAVRALGPGFDVEVLDIHHGAKRDAPSGTARLLGRAAGRGRSATPAALAARPHGADGPRAPGSIGFAALRGGGVVGEHQVWLMGQGERLMLGHVAEDRTIFATGAVEAALWLCRRPPGRHALASRLDEA